MAWCAEGVCVQGVCVGEVCRELCREGVQGVCAGCVCRGGVKGCM